MASLRNKAEYSAVPYDNILKRVPTFKVVLSLLTRNIMQAFFFFSALASFCVKTMRDRQLSRDSLEVRLCRSFLLCLLQINLNFLALIMLSARPTLSGPSTGRAQDCFRKTKQPKCLLFPFSDSLFLSLCPVKRILSSLACGN